MSVDSQVEQARELLVHALFNLNSFGVLPENRGAALANAAAAVVVLAKDPKATRQALALVRHPHGAPLLAPKSQPAGACSGTISRLW